MAARSAKTARKKPISCVLIVGVRRNLSLTLVLNATEDRRVPLRSWLGRSKSGRMKECGGVLSTPPAWRLPSYERLNMKHVTSFDPNDARLPEKFRVRFEIRDCGYLTLCWVWLKNACAKGYGGFTLYPGKSVRPYRYCYVLLVGPVPDGLELDHLCRNRACCNPAHLEPVTHRENVLRGEGLAAKQARQTHCIHGHPFSGSNLIFQKSGRACRACHNASTKEYKRQRRAAEIALKGDDYVKPGEQTHCKHGHPFSGTNLQVSKSGYRMCRTCRRIVKSKSYRRKRAAEKALKAGAL